MTRIFAGGVCLDRTLAVPRLRIGTKHRITGQPRTSVGGGAANQAMATAALAPGSELTLFVYVGNDDAGASIRLRLAQYGIALSLEPCPDLSTSESCIISETEREGSGTIVSVVGARARELPVERIREALAGAEAFHLCAPAVNAQIAPLLEAARSESVPAFFALGSAQIDGLDHDTLADQLEPGAELVICNHVEATRLIGTRDVRAQLRALRFLGHVRTSVVTLGAEGLCGFDNLGYCDEPAYCDGNRLIVDDTGAGDAAAAAIIDALLRGLPLQNALACGARNGFEACTGHGVENVCTRQQLETYAQSRRRKAA